MPFSNINMDKLSPETIAIIRAIRESSSDQQRQIAAMLAEHKRIEQDLQRIKDAFPDSDIDGHRRYHESLIEWRVYRNKFMKELLAQVAKVGILSGLGWLLWGAWQLTLMEIKK